MKLSSAVAETLPSLLVYIVLYFTAHNKLQRDKFRFESALIKVYSRLHSNSFINWLLSYMFTITLHCFILAHFIITKLV